MQVTFDFEGTVDGEKFEGGAAQDFKLVLGSGRMIPGFEDGIIGMKKGEEKVIDVTSLKITKLKTLLVNKLNSKSM